MRMKSLCGALLCAVGLVVGVTSNASATIFYSLASMPGALPATTVSPAYDQFVGSCSTSGGNCQGNTTGTGPDNLSLATQTTWLNDNSLFPVTASGGTQISGSLSTNTGTFSNGTAYQIWAVHGDSWYLAFFYATAIVSFTISNLPNNISGVFSFNPVPLPPAVILFGSALFGMSLLARRRKKGLTQAA
jgi:hypothetical protein